jgi:hypothetical protein
VITFHFESVIARVIIHACIILFELVLARTQTAKMPRSATLKKMNAVGATLDAAATTVSSPLTDGGEAGAS